MAASDALKAQPVGATRPDADVRSYEARFVSSIDAGLSDADADDVMGTDELERWLAARRQVATPEEPR